MIKRMWIDQPSSKQELHHMHGQNVLANDLGGDYLQVYPVKNKCISMVVGRRALVDGWQTDWTKELIKPEHGRKVLARYKNSHGKNRIVIAMWIEAHTKEVGEFDEFHEHCDYDEGSDQYYWPQGWYECVENWESLSAVFISEIITHWQPLPECPDD